MIFGIRFPVLLTQLLCLAVIIFSLSDPLVVSAKPTQEYLFEQALNASRSGDFSAALPLWDQVIESFPEDAAAFSNRGNVRLALGDPQGAIADQTFAIKLSPEEFDPYLNRGIAEELLKCWEEAENDYNFVLGNDPVNSSALYNLGNVFGSQGDWIKAGAFYEKASMARPGFVMARSNEALVAYQLGEVEDAEDEFRNLIRRYPMFADARAALSALLWRRGLFGEAESNWAAAVGLDSRYKQEDWLREIRRWPPKPTSDLMAFLCLERP